MSERRFRLHRLALIGLGVSLVTSCAHRSDGPKQIQAKGAPASLVELVLEADALQPENALLLLRASDCAGGTIRVFRSSPDTYEWKRGSLTHLWHTREEFRSNLQAEATEWNSCGELDLYFACLTGVDDAYFGLTIECADSILARRTDTGKITLGPTIYHNN